MKQNRSVKYECVSDGKCVKTAKEMMESKKELESREELKELSKEIQFAEVPFDGMDVLSLKEWPDKNKLAEGDIWILREGIPSKYYGHKSAASLTYHLSNLLLLPPIIPLKDANDLTKFQDLEETHPVRVIAYFSQDTLSSLLSQENPSPPLPSSHFSNFLQAAKHFQPSLPFFTIEAPFSRRFSLKKEGQIALIQPLKKIQLFKEEKSSDARQIIQWVNEHCDPLWEEIREDNLYLFLHQISQPKVKLVVFFFEDEKRERPFAAFKSLAKQFEGEGILFFSMNAIKMKKLADGFAKKDVIPPHLLAYSPLSSNRFSYKGDFVLSKISKWLS